MMQIPGMREQLLVELYGMLQEESADNLPNEVNLLTFVPTFSFLTEIEPRVFAAIRAHLSGDEKQLNQACRLLTQASRDAEVRLLPYQNVELSKIYKIHCMEKKYLRKDLKKDLEKKQEAEIERLSKKLIAEVAAQIEDQANSDSRIRKIILYPDYLKSVVGNWGALTPIATGRNGKFYDSVDSNIPEDAIPVAVIREMVRHFMKQKFKVHPFAVKDKTDFHSIEITW
jgi:hypothetical protein